MPILSIQTILLCIPHCVKKCFPLNIDMFASTCLSNISRHFMSALMFSHLSCISLQTVKSASGFHHVCKLCVVDQPVLVRVRLVQDVLLDDEEDHGDGDDYNCLLLK